jgi:signal transduction histidine kinase/CheY-like chemotaxis protein/HPt (histidine-containing phosphotransfer) domain-containing protein
MDARLALATTPIIALLWAGIASYLVQKYSSDLAGAAQESRNLSYAFEENIRRTVEAIDTTVRGLRAARVHDPQHFDLGSWELASGLKRDLQLRIYLADRTGRIVASTVEPGAGPVSIADRDHFLRVQNATQDDLVISRAVIGRVSHRWTVQFVRRLTDAAGAFDGAVVVSLDPEFLARFHASLDNGRTALLLAGQDGFLRAAAPVSMEPLDTDLKQTPLMARIATAAQGTLEMSATADGIDRIYSWRRVDPYGLLVAVGMSRADALADFRSNFRGCVGIGICLTAVTLVVGMMLAHNRRDLMRSREILLAAVSNINQGLMVIDADRRVPVLNARAVELLGLPDELTKPGYLFDALLDWQVQAGEFEGVEAERVRTLVGAGGIVQGDSVYNRTRRNGMVLEIRTKALETGLAVRTFTDITEQQNNARVLADARDVAEAAVRARSEFLAVMSHEIRTPLNGVIGVAGLLEDMELGPTQREYVRLIRQSGDHLLVLINDIMDFSRLEADRVQLEETDFNPRELAQSVIGTFLSQASAKGLRLSAVAADTLPQAVSGDPGRLRQVLLNLISNAVKFTDEGWVRLTVTDEPAGDGPNGEPRHKLMFSVADSGIGMIPEAIERMFQEFTQMDGSISRRFGGSGLGLAICRRLVELMGGTIRVESQPNAGSTFRFDVCVKLARAPKVAAPEAAPNQEPGLRILLAEDNETNRLVALRVIERLGHQADTVGTGVAVIAALAQAQYDLVLMDVMMPEMDGITATRKIRAGETPDARIVIVGLTAGSSKEQLSACLQSGMNAVTTKPITIARLRSAIAEGFAAAGRGPVAKPPPPAMPRLQELAEMLGEEAVGEIVQAFIEDTQSNLATMRAAAAREDANTIYRCAHSVAGAARNVGAEALAARASMLEESVGSLSATRIMMEVAALQTDMDAALHMLSFWVAVDG